MDFLGRKAVILEIRTIGLDLAKNVFQDGIADGVDASGLGGFPSHQVGCVTNGCSQLFSGKSIF